MNTAERREGHRPDERVLLAELMTTLQGNLLAVGLGNAVVALALAAGFWQSASRPWLLAWLLLQALHSLFSVWAWWRVRGRRASVRSAPHRARASMVAALLSGLLWAAAVPLFWPAERLDLQLLLITLISGLTSGAIHSLSAHLPAFLAFFAPNVVAVVAACLGQGGSLHLAIAGTALVYGVTGARFAKGLHDLQRRALAQREQLAVLAADLAAQKERAEAASQAKSRFLAAASHDIRQPVHALTLFLGAFDERSLSGRNAQLIGPLRESARGLREMLDGVLDLSRAEAGTVQAELQALQLQPLLDALEREFAPLAEAKGLLLRTVPTRAAVWADAALTERVLRNLVANALRYTERGGVLLGVRRRGAQQVVEVWDSGPGIAPDEQVRVFDEFQRGSGAAGAERAGLGLGLAIAQRFAQAQGGTLSLRSRPGRGSVFALSLPACAPPQPRSTRPGGGSLIDLRGRSVWLLDDDAEVRRATLMLLADWGCAARALAHPNELSALLLQPERPDAVITDNQFQGEELAPAVAAQLGPAVPLLVLTGQRHAPQLAPLLAAGVPVLAKPVAPEDLRAALGRLLT